MCLRQCHLVSQDVIDTNATASFDLLLSALFVLLAHVHDRCSRGSIVLVTVHALVLLVDLVCHPAVLAHSLLRLAANLVLVWHGCGS